MVMIVCCILVMIVAPEYYGSAWRGKKAPEIPVTKSVRVNYRTRTHIFCWLYRTTHWPMKSR